MFGDEALLGNAKSIRDALHVLRQRGRPVLRLHLTDRAAGIATLTNALED